MVIPIVELAAGLLLIAGWRVREALIALGAILLIATYGHLLKEPLFRITEHILPRSFLLAAVFLLPDDEDRLSVAAWLRRRQGQR